MTFCVLHTDDTGAVWTLRSNGIPVSVLVDDIIKYYPANNYYIFGSADNRRTITNLYIHSLRHTNVPRIYVGNPAIQTNDVAAVLHELSINKVATSRTFHEFKTVDFINLQFLNCDFSQRDTFFANHFLSPVFQFMGLGVMDAFNFIECIVDPRWYVAPRPEYRFVKLLQRFGLTVDAVVTSKPKTDITDYNYELITDMVSYVDKRLFAPIEIRHIPFGLSKAQWQKVLECRRVLNFIVSHWYQYLTGIKTVDMFDYFGDIRSLRANYLNILPYNTKLK